MQATLRSVPSSPTFGYLRFSGAGHRGGGDFKCLATVEANSETYEVELEMIDPYRRDMLGFFEDMGRHRRGWSGVMSWESEFAEMKLDVRNPDGGDVTVDVLMRWPPSYEDEWSGSLVVNADELPRAAEAMRKLMGAESGSRLVTPARPRTWQPL
jgi:hypothetical protein